MVTFLPVCECCTVVSLWMMGKLYFLMICKLNRSCYGAQSKYQMDVLQSEVLSHELMTWELMKAAGESWQLVPVMNVMLWYFLCVTHKGYGHNHACHVSFSFAGIDTMVSFNVICGFFFTSQRCVLESSFVWILAGASVVDEIHVKVLFPPICVIWVSCCAGQLHQSWSIFWGYILPLVLWSLYMDLASTSWLSSFRLVIHFLDVFCKWAFPSVPPNTFCCILYLFQSFWSLYVDSRLYYGAAMVRA